LILPRADIAVMKKFLEAARTRFDRFLKAAGNFMKESAKNCQPQQLLGTCLYEYLRLLETIL
jgi:hypothetical protein